MKRCRNCFEVHGKQHDVCPYCGYYAGQPPKELNHLFPETVLAGRYMIGQVLGFGGFGITYKAWDRKLETVVAIKEYYPSGLVNRIPGTKEVIVFAGSKIKEYSYGLSRFLEEARNTAKFRSHKNIVSVYEYFEANNTAYIVMEYLDGISLSGFLKDNALDLDESINIVTCVASALNKLHSCGIIHRDISPDNIFLCLNGSVKLIDFGAARFSNREEKQLTIILKPGFAPPEQYEKISAQGPWTDIYALGATLYYMVTGRKPEESTDRKTNDTLVPPDELNPEIPEFISNAILKAMALETHLRFDNVDDFSQAVTGQKTVVSLTMERKRRRMKRFAGITAATMAVVLTSSLLVSRLIKQKEAETLPDANIYLQYELSGNPSADKAKADTLNKIAEDFTSCYPNVSIELIGHETDGYADSILTSGTAAGGKAVAVFESTHINAVDLLRSADDISTVWSRENTKTCYFMDEHADNMRLPIGFVAPVIYCNTMRSPFGGTSINNISQLLDNIADTSGIAVHTSAKDTFSQVFGEQSLYQNKVEVVNSSEAFASGDFAFYIAYSNEFTDIQSKLPGRYAIAYFEAEKIPCNFSDYYSMAQHLSEDDEKVALAFLDFLLSDNAQDQYFVQNWTGKLPLNANALKLVEDIYIDFSGFFKNLSNYTF